MDSAAVHNTFDLGIFIKELSNSINFDFIVFKYSQLKIIDNEFFSIK